MIDYQAVSHSYAVDDTNNVVFIRGPKNPADGLTKIVKCHAFYHMLLTRRYDFIVGKRIICFRNRATPDNYPSTASICYVRSSITDVLHPSRDTTSSYRRFIENVSLQTVPLEIMENMSITLV